MGGTDLFTQAVHKGTQGERSRRHGVGPVEPRMVDVVDCFKIGRWVGGWMEWVGGWVGWVGYIPVSFVSRAWKQPSQ